ncbi:MAG: hypothetical protein GIW95_08320 [Candidatus Eremiobacteraeota bacterium]|nr:hypothetical protein [Candidatus Eremiobacteraeota bacterium]
MIDETSSLQDVCFEVCTALTASGTTAVLTGGGAATIYAPHRYQSRDADFVITFGGDARAAATLAVLGYKEFGGIYRHARNRFTLDFPPGPLSIGSDLVEKYNTLTKSNLHLNVLNRTDCVRDRLCAYYFWNDLSSLTTAVDVALSGEIDRNTIVDWSRREGMAQRCTHFIERLGRST